MKNPVLQIPFVMLLCFFNVSAVYGEMDITASLSNALSVKRIQALELLEVEEEWALAGEINMGFRVSPGFSFEENFQGNALVDCYFSRNFLDGDLVIYIKEAYLDFLFGDLMACKTGFMKMDFGHHSFFHPLNIGDFAFEFLELYSKISLGGNDIGFTGIPGAALQFTFPPLFDELQVNFFQSAAAIELSPSLQAYFFSRLTFIYNRLNFSLIAGYGYSEETENLNGGIPALGKRPPAGGVALSLLLPLDVMFFFEGLLKRESYRPYIEDGTQQWLREGPFFNLTCSLQKSISLERVNLNLNGEYFFYHEGLTKGMTDDLVSYIEGLTTAGERATAARLYLLPLRTQQHHILAGISLSEEQSRLQAGLNFQTAFRRDFLTALSLTKAFHNSYVNGTFVYQKTTDTLAEIDNIADLTVYFTMGMEL